MLASSEVPLVTKRKSLDELWLHVTFRCNLSCNHCMFSCSPDKEKPGTMDLAETLNYIGQAVKLKTKFIYITGGEPLLWPYMEEFLERYYEDSEALPLTILTNGTLIDEKWAKLLQNYYSRGLNLRISLECYTRATHESYRGANNFDRTLTGIRNLNNFGIKPWIAYVNKSGGSLPEGGDMALEKDFVCRLGEDYNLEIAGLKVIGAYKKGRFSNLKQLSVKAAIIRDKLNKIQCSYGVAVSKLGIVPCPILTDEPTAVINDNLENLVVKDVAVNYDICASCFATGSTCGQ